jgi:hypothetical protein
MGAPPFLAISSLFSTKSGKLPQSLQEHYRSGKQKQMRLGGNVSPQYREKFPTV